MSPAETHYPTSEQELLVIKEAFEHWQHYLLAARFEVHSDHESLKYLQTQKNLKGKLLRWLDFIQQFDFGDIKYLPEKKNPVGDALSRPPIHEQAFLSILDTEGTVTLSCMDATLAPTPVPATQASMPQSDLCSRLQEDIKTCPDFGKIYAWLSSNDPRARAYRTKYDIVDGILRFRTSKNDAYRICVPRSLRATL
jgi:hypothetical protein